MVKVKTEIDGVAQSELSKATKRLFIGLLISGIIGLILYFVLKRILTSPLIDLLLLFLVPLVASCLGLILLKINIIKLAKGHFINYYDFKEDCFIVSTNQNNEVLGSQKVYYKNIKKVKETNDYLFLYVTNRNAYIINKNNISKSDISKVKELLKTIKH